MKLPKAKIEMIKTVVIAVLVTAIVAFISGMHYEHATNARTQTQAKALAKVLSASTTVSKQ